ncbi:MAG: leucine-rich repeat domain-containing protein, partial [Clostridia bacterium]|nr:leucine-rich repeat domain-containing protein [Clostridia bacterium]
MANGLKRFIAAMLAAATLGNSAPALAYGMERGGSAVYNEYGSGAEGTGITEDGFAYSASDTAVTITGYTGEGGIITVPSEIGGLPVTAIGITAFDGCAAITKITLPDSIESIDDFAFRRCTSLESINYPMSLREVSDQYSGLGGIFQGCPKLKSITVPEGITAIPDYAFKSCEYIENITLPSTVAVIGKNAFEGCERLNAIELPEGLSAIGQECFSDCVSLTEVNIPDGVSVIEYGTFQNCVLLAEVRIPDSVTSIGGAAFDGCAAITKITLPDSIESIGNFAFRRCTNLESINYPRSLREVSDQYSGLGGIFEDCPKLKSITIPEGITAIPDYAFKSCEYIENITLPSTLKSIGTDAFTGCTSLKAVDLPEGLETIMYDAFEDCVSLRSVYIPATVKTMGFYVFGGCTGLTSVNYPEGLEKLLGIGGRIFEGCTSLKTMIVPEGVTKIFPDFFTGSCFESIILPESLESIGEQAFSECESLIGLAVPAGVTEIGYGVFWDSPNLTVYTQRDSMATVYCIENDVPFAVTGNDSSFEGELLRHPGCSLTIEPSSNGYAMVNVNIEADEAHWQETYYRTVNILLPDGCSLIESTLTLNGVMSRDHSYDPDLRSLTVDVADSSSRISFALDVQKQGMMGTCASMSFYDPNKGSGEQWRKEIVGVACGGLELFNLRCDEMTSKDTLEVWGMAPAGSEVSLYIEGGDEPACITEASRAGIYRAAL